MVVRPRGDGDDWGMVGWLVSWSGLGEGFCIKAEQKGMISNNKT